MTDLVFRKARLEDLEAIIAMLADDTFGIRREDASLPLARCYRDAFAAIEANPSQMLMAVFDGEEIVGTFQLSFLPGLALQGLTRGQIEAVRVSGHRRGSGIGKQLIRWAVEECRRQGCGIVQLTTNRGRADAHRFYERLGFVQSHFGYKLNLFKD